MKVFVCNSPNADDVDSSDFKVYELNNLGSILFSREFTASVRYFSWLGLYETTAFIVYFVHVFV